MSWLTALKDWTLNLFGAGPTTEIPVNEVKLGLEVNEDGTISVTIGCETITAPLSAFVEEGTTMDRLRPMIANLRVATLMEARNPDDPQAIKATADARAVKVIA